MARAHTLCCMVSSTGTAKARTLGAALRDACEKCGGVGLRELERRTKIPNSSLSRMLAGERLAKPEHVLAILDAIDAPEAVRADVLHVSQAPDTGHSWMPIGVPEPRSHLIAMLEFERTASSITEVAMTIVPGLLQTAEYARAIIRAEAAPDDVEPRVAVRVGRREILNRREPVRMTALVGETAIRDNIGGLDVMTEQWHHLLEMAEKPNIDFRVVPEGIGFHPGLVTPLFSVFDFAQASPIVHIETRFSGMYLHEEDDVDANRDAVARVLDVALSPEMSVAKVAEILTDRTENA